MRDISVPFAVGTPAWPGDTPVGCGWAWRMADGASVNVSRLETSPHVGTHADAPLHVADGAPGADALPVTAFLGAAHLVDLTKAIGEVSWEMLRAAGCPEQVTRLLIRTDCTVASGTFPEAWPTLAPETVAALTARGLRLLAVDCPSVDARTSTALPVHHALFGGGAYVLENLDLRDVPAGPYDLVALPLKVGAIDAAPVRAFLRPSP